MKFKQVSAIILQMPFLSAIKATNAIATERHGFDSVFSLVNRHSVAILRIFLFRP